MTTPRQSDWSALDFSNDSNESLTHNAGLSIYPTGGQLPRSIFAIGAVPVPALIGGRAAKTTALHLCYKARPSAKLNAVAVAKQKFDVSHRATCPPPRPSSATRPSGRPASAGVSPLRPERSAGRRTFSR